MNLEYLVFEEMYRADPLSLLPGSYPWMRRRRLPCWTHSFVMFRHVSSPSCWVFRLEAEYLWHPVYSLCVEYEVLRSACQGLDFPKVMFQKIAERQLGICTDVLSIIAILCYFVLFHTISWYIILCHTISYYFILQYVTICSTISCYFMLFHIIAYSVCLYPSFHDYGWGDTCPDLRCQVDSLYRKKCAPSVSSAGLLFPPAAVESQHLPRVLHAVALCLTRMWWKPHIHTDFWALLYSFEMLEYVGICYGICRNMLQYVGICWNRIAPCTYVES